MRFLYVILGVLGGLVCLLVLYFFGMIAMAYGGGRGSMQVVVPYVLLAMGAGTLATLIAAFMNPRRPRTRHLLAVGAGLWIGAVTLMSIVSFVDPVSTVSVSGALQSFAVLVVPGLLPLAALFVARLTKVPA
jgi:hypothetical protein